MQNVTNRSDQQNPRDIQRFEQKKERERERERERNPRAPASLRERKLV